MNRGKRLAMVLGALLCLQLLAGRAGVQAASSSEEPDGCWLVRLREDADTERVEPIPYAEGWYSASSFADLLPLMREGEVLQCVQDAELELLEGAAPNDPALDQQWYLSAIGAQTAWEAGLTGTGVRVAVIDSGVNFDHEDLKDAPISGWNFLGPEESRDETNYRDDLGHGSLVCGILSARLNNGLGGAGLCPDAEVLVLRCFSGVGGTANSGSGSAKTVISALGYAMEQDVDVINLSIGGTSSSLRALEPILQEAADRGILLVAACGNRGGTTLYYPAAFDCVTGVGWTDETGQVSASSQRNASVYVTAPGTNIYGPDYRSETAYQTDSGGSFAAPMAAAMGVLVKQADPAIGTEGFRYLLRQIAEDLGDPGRDDAYGFGAVRIGALTEALSAPQPIRYETNGGILALEGYDNTYQIGKGALARLPGPDQICRDGFRFTGWYPTPEASEAITEIPAGSVGPVTLYAGWEEIPPPEPYQPHAAEEPCPGAAFEDLPPYGNWAHDPIGWAVVRGITTGTDPTHFSPKRVCSRAQVVTFLWRCFGSPPAEAGPTFSDVPPDAWYADAVSWAVAAGVTNGTDAAHFSPNRACTRGQAMTFLWNAMGKPEPAAEDNPFLDVHPGRYYYKAVLWAVETGVTRGVSPDRFGTEQSCTRAHAVAFLYNSERNR